MSKLDWSKIRSGPVFQSLAGLLVRQEDPGASSYDRPGKDAGIDLKSSDGKCVYQAKYISNGNFSTAIRAAKDELGKIKKYKEPSHPNAKHWSKVERWCLITNTSKNPPDEMKWNNQVVTEFKREGLSVELWDCPVLEDKLINKYQQIRDEYFEEENRVLLSFPEALDRFKNEQVISCALDVEFTGRSHELDSAIKFLRDPVTRVLPVHGPGGVGKTRFALELAKQASEQEACDVYWANTETMALNSKWFSSLVASRKALLVIDEPEDPSVIKALLEQISLSRLQSWKVIILTRTPKDPILDILRNPRLKILHKELELSPLVEDDFGRFVSKLLARNKRLSQTDIQALTAAIQKSAGGFPVWANLAVYLVESGKSCSDLPKDEYGLAHLYCEEVLKHVPDELEDSSQRFRTLIRHLALFHPINVENDDKLLAFIQSKVELLKRSELNAVIANLVKRNFCRKQGRLLGIKPDVIRDFVLFDWLGRDQAYGKELIAEITGTADFPHPKQVLRQLARAELSNKLSGKNLYVLDPIVQELEKTAKEGPLDRQYSTLDIASSFCFSRPLDLVRVSKAIRSNWQKDHPLNDELMGRMNLTHSDLVFKLPWEIYEAGICAVTEREVQEVFEELLQLARYEFVNIGNQKKHLKNDGKRALVLIQRLTQKHGESYQNYENTICKWVFERIEKLLNLDTFEEYVLEFLVKGLLAIERNDFFSQGNRIVFTRYLISSKSKEANNRQNIRKALWNLAKSENIPPKKRVLVWKLLSEAHGQTNIATAREVYKNSEIEYKYWEAELIDDLENMKEFLKGKKYELFEVNHFREIWKWHSRFDDRPELKILTNECESLTNLNDDIRILEKLYNYDNSRNKNLYSKQIAKSLISKQLITDFIDKAYQFTSGSDKYWYGICDIANVLGEDYGSTLSVQEFLTEVINGTLNDKKYVSVACAALSAIASRIRREAPDELGNFLTDTFSKISNINTKADFLYALYSQPHPELRGLLIEQDLEFVSSLVNEIDLRSKLDSLFMYALGYMTYLDFDRIRVLVENLWKNVEENDAANAFSSLTNGLWYRSLFAERFSQYKHVYTSEIYEWLIQQLQNVPSLDDVEGLFQHELVELQKMTGCVLNIAWLVSFLQKREAKWRIKDQKKWKIFSSRNLLVRCIKKIDQTSSSEPETIQAVNDLLSFNSHNSYFGYSLPEVAINIDPNGLIIPFLIVSKLKNQEFVWETEGLKDGYEWYRYAGYYPVNSAPWRIIATETCRIASQLSTIEARRRLYSALLDHRIQSYSGTAGEVPHVFVSAVECAINDEKNETDGVLKEFMTWRREVAEKELEREKARIEEERI